MHNYSLSQPARESLKQLWEESCTAADNLGTNGVKELEKNLLLFRKFCNEKKEKLGWLFLSKKDLQFEFC